MILHNGCLAEVRIGDCVETMRAMESESVQCCITSPPYFGLRSYLPNVVRLKVNLPLGQQHAILRELSACGVSPTSD